LTQTFFIHQLFPCSQTADHTFDQVRILNLPKMWGGLRNYEGAAPYPIAIEGQEEIKQLVEPRFHPHTPFGRYEAIEPHMDGTDRTYSATSEMRADGSALAY
jgi:hypothetical protein